MLNNRRNGGNASGIKKENKVDNLDNRLEDLEKEREKNLKFFCDKLEFSLIDIAFELEP